jgi:hypothetical protein
MQLEIFFFEIIIRYFANDNQDPNLLCLKGGVFPAQLSVIVIKIRSASSRMAETNTMAWRPTKRIEGDAIHLDDLQISFQRTLRMPDNENSHKLPPTLGRFSLFDTEEYAKNLTPSMAQKGGVFFPMYRKAFLL